MDPLHQFEIHALLPIKLGATDVSFTNSSLWMAIAIIAVTSFLTMSMRGRALVPGRTQSMAELSYEFIANMIRENAGQSSMRFFPAIFTLFMFVLFGNLLGMVPYSFTFTSHIIVTFGLALTVFLAVTVLGIALHGLHFFSFFVPKGVPWIMMPLMIPIEVLSYLTRPVSLSIRLFANMMAGHTMLKVFAGFTVLMIGALGPVAGGALGMVPLAINVALTGFEFLVAFLQAYVFTVLTCIYLNDAIHLH
ncbi:MAG: F0F1 ATP synthase subunit A [Alphaproteobacteria bacterium]|nr:F0F1 ATP synthase subunit A [Alphaproteobacteria bacterium]